MTNALLLLLISPAHPGIVPTKLDIQVVVRFSVQELDPENPGNSFVECIVRSNSSRAVSVPTVYTDRPNRGIILKGGTNRWGLWLYRWDGAKEQILVALPPNQECTVFKAPLKEILFLDPTQKKQVGWTWEA